MHRRVSDDGQAMGNEWLFHERWTSRAALDTHLQQPHMTSFFAATHDWVDGAVDISIWSKAD